MLPKSSEIPIGILHSLSGSMAVSERPLVGAALMAVDEINQAGGILGHRLATIVSDGTSDPAQFSRLARRLIEQDHVESIFGCWTSSCRKAVKPVVEEHAGLLWYPVQYEGLEESPNIVYMGSCPNQHIEPAVRWFLTQGKRRCLLIGSEYVFPRTVNRLISALWKSGGGTVLDDFYAPPEWRDFRELAERCRDFKPDVIFNTLNGDSNVAFFRNLRAVGINAGDIPVMSFCVAEGEQSVLALEGAGNFACWSYFQTLETPENQGFLQHYHSRFGQAQSSSDPIVMAYSQIFLWKEAVEAANSFKSSDVQKCLVGRRYLSPAGWLEIQPNHHLNKSVLIGQARDDGQFDIVWKHGGEVRPNPWLGLEELDAPDNDVIKELLSQFPQSVHYAAQLELEIAQRKAAEEKFRMVSHYTRSLIEASLDPLVTINPQGKITDVNRATELVTGVARDHLIGSDFSDFFTQPEQARAGYQEVFLHGTVRDYPLAIRHVSGRVTDVLYNASVYRDDSGIVQGVFAAARDVTVRKHLEEELRHLNEDLERRVTEEVAKNRAKDHLLIQQSRLAAMGEMVHNIAHQWRQPLNALSIILANIKDAYDYHELSEEFMNNKAAQAHRLLQRMSTTIDDFRDFFRPDREPGEFDISQSVEDALFVMEASLKNNRIGVDKDLPGGLVAYGFSNQFSQVVLNVIANAKDAIQERHVEDGEIAVRLHQDGDKGILTVEDNAGGIAEEVLPKIFDPYFTTKEKGSGIGLYMSKMILERNLGGNIEVSVSERGTSVVLSIPLLSTEQRA